MIPEFFRGKNERKVAAIDTDIKTNEAHNNVRPKLKRDKSQSHLQLENIPKTNIFAKCFSKMSKAFLQTDAYDKDTVIMQTLLREQTLYYEKPNLFHYVVQNDLSGLQSRLEKEEQETGDFNADKKLIEKDIDPTGANIIHCAYLLKNYEIGRWLVQSYPEQAFLPYENNCDDYDEKYDLEMSPEDMPYTGQNILHIAIVHKNLGEIRWLLEFYSEHKFSCPLGLEILLNTGTSGTFFSLGTSEFYCGCYPIHFAAGSNSPELFDLVLAYFTSSSTVNKQVKKSNSHSIENDEDQHHKNSDISSYSVKEYGPTKASLYREIFEKKFRHINLGNNALFTRDQYGNNCLHICVIYRLNEMYDHIKRVAKSLLRNEIKHAYGQYLRSDRSNPVIRLKPLPAWDVVTSKDTESPDGSTPRSSDTNSPSSHGPTPASSEEHEKNQFRESVSNIGGALLNKSASVLQSMKDSIENVNKQTSVHQVFWNHVNRTDNDPRSLWWKIKHTPFFKSISKFWIQILTRYIPYYSLISVSRIKRYNLAKIVADEDLNNGFYFGYSLSETPIYPPNNGERVSKAVLQKWLDKTIQTKVEERFEWVLNEQFHSPLTLTAAGTDSSVKGTDEEEEQEKDTIQFIINQIKQFRWEYGPIRSFLLYLEGIELPYDVQRFGQSASSKPLPPYAEFEMFGVVEWICITNSDRSVLIPEVKKLIEAKWVNMGLPLFFKDFILWVIITILLTVLVLYDNNLPEPNPDRFSTWLVTIIYPLNLFFILILATTELPGILYYGLEYWGILGKRIRGAAKLNKLLTTITICLYITLCFFKLYEYRYYLNSIATDDNSNSGLVINNITNTTSATSASAVVEEFSTMIVRELKRVGGIGGDTAGGNSTSTDDPLVGSEYFLPTRKIEVILVLVAWIKMYYYFMGFDQTGPFVLSIANIVGGDVPFFLMFFVIILVAFSAALCVITMTYDTSSNYGFYIFMGGIFDLIQITVNIPLPSTSNFDPSNVPQDLMVMYSFVITLFYVIVVLMFINILIAMISNTYQIYTDKNDSLLLLEKYNIMCGLDMSMFWLRTPEASVSTYAVQINQESKPKRRPRPPRFDKKTSGKINDTAQQKVEIISHKVDDKKKEAPVKAIPIYAFELQVNENNWWRESKMTKLEDDDTTTITLLILDPQNDFHEGRGKCGDRDYIPEGSLAVKGSNEDAQRIHDLIMNNLDKIDNIVVTMDSHHPNHIAHAICWKKGRMHPDMNGKRDYKSGPNQKYRSFASPKNSKFIRRKSPSTLAAPSTNNNNTMLASAEYHSDAKHITAENHLKVLDAEAKMCKQVNKLPPLNAAASSILSDDHFKKRSDDHFQAVAEGKPAPRLPAASKYTETVGIHQRQDNDYIETKEAGPGGDWGLLYHGTSNIDSKLRVTLNDSIQHPEPFTVITHSDIERGVWEPVNTSAEYLEWCLYYTKELEKQGKMKLTIWPNHCIIGSNGHAVVPLIDKAVQKWATHKAKSIDYVMKGQNLKTEMYSALSADVEDPEDPSTAFNQMLMSKLRISDKVLICGQARSHVVKYTVLDLLKYWHEDLTRLCLLEDGCSSVFGYEKQGLKFLEDMRKRGLTVCKCDKVFPKEEDEVKSSEENKNSEKNNT